MVDTIYFIISFIFPVRLYRINTFTASHTMHVHSPSPSTSFDLCTLTHVIISFSIRWL